MNATDKAAMRDTYQRDLPIIPVVILAMVAAAAIVPALARSR
jgi:hypothetical protein